jgi:hypothetical protein
MDNNFTRHCVKVDIAANVSQKELIWINNFLKVSSRAVFEPLNMRSFSLRAYPDYFCEPETMSAEVPIVQGS